MRTRLVAGEGGRPPDDSVLADDWFGSHDSDFFRGALAAALLVSAPCVDGSARGRPRSKPCSPAMGAVCPAAVGGARGTAAAFPSCCRALPEEAAASSKAPLPAAGSVMALVAAVPEADAAPGGVGTKTWAGDFVCCAGLPAEPLSRVSHGASAPVAGGGGRPVAARALGGCEQTVTAMLSTGVAPG